ncbi:hypothetical protein CHLRE_02g142426v5 [Chlamydomonas reinhardtii]|uniref:Retrotransposon gag domain-containing protein n=1 Tax=Chlamydomonas reinhardtii TaxID=3055 RepID=A0A2K3E4E7_CHLRE|nr:uncharacterized protein CHLRE_02g142426v5 [Chlamydomonas reinhardtii]PNW87661.1 hypothetical protein CHLRE_02g142426v5 [Chlamydomonas reinhardtii]
MAATTQRDDMPADADELQPQLQPPRVINASLAANPAGGTRYHTAASSPAHSAGSDGQDAEADPERLRQERDAARAELARVQRQQERDRATAIAAQTRLAEEARRLREAQENGTTAAAAADAPPRPAASAPAGPAPAAGRPGRLLGGIHAAPGALPIPHADRQELQQHHAHVVPQQTVQHQTAMPAASAHGAQAMSISQDREEGEVHHSRPAVDEPRPATRQRAEPQPRHHAGQPLRLDALNTHINSFCSSDIGASAMDLSRDVAAPVLMAFLKRHMDDMGVHYEPHIDLLMKGKGGAWAQDPPVVRIANGDDLGFQEVQPRRVRFVDEAGAIGSNGVDTVGTAAPLPTSAGGTLGVGAPALAGATDGTPPGSTAQMSPVTSPMRMQLHAQGQTHTAPDPAPAPAPAPHYRDRHDHRDEPRVVIHAFTGVLKGTITNIATWFDVLVMILSRRGIDPVASFLMYLGGQAQQWGLTWFRAWEREHNRQPTVDELRHDFLMQWDNLHLHTANAARQRLHNHEVTQTGTVSAYITQFRLIMQDIPDMHMNDRVAHFRAGLQKGLQAKYAFKPGSTVPWDNVYELMNHILEMTTATNFANGKTQPSVAAADTPASRSPSLPARGGIKKGGRARNHGNGGRAGGGGRHGGGGHGAGGHAGGGRGGGGGHAGGGHGGYGRGGGGGGYGRGGGGHDRGGHGGGHGRGGHQHGRGGGGGRGRGNLTAADREAMLAYLHAQREADNMQAGLNPNVRSILGM